MMEDNFTMIKTKTTETDITRNMVGKKTTVILMTMDTLIFLLQHLDFVINLKNLVLKLSQQTEF